MSTRAKNDGVTLVELLVAMGIGSLILLAVGSVYIGNKQTYRTSESVSRLQDEARFAILQLRSAVQQAGFIGRLDDAMLLNGIKGSGSDLPDLAGDCESGWYINLDRALESPDASTGNPYATTCLNSTNFRRRWLAGSDLLVVRRADSTVTTDAGDATNDGYIFVRADTRRGEVFEGGGTLPAGYDSATLEDRRLITEMFYLTPDDIEDGDGVPALRRLRLTKNGTAPALRSERVARYVEDFQVQFGEDTNGDGNADRFVEPADAMPEQAVSVRVWLLFRSETLETDYSAPPTFTVGEHLYTVPAGTEHYRRLLITQTYTLRNL